MDETQWIAQERSCSWAPDSWVAEQRECWARQQPAVAEVESVAKHVSQEEEEGWH